LQETEHQLSKYLQRLSLIVVAILITIAFVHAGRYAIINSDSGTYLATAEQVAQGKVLYKNMYVGYTPIGIYFFALIKYMFGSQTTYLHYIYLVIAFIFLGGGIIYQLASAISGKKHVGLLAALVYLMLAYKYEGIYIVLEPFVIVFGLGALYCLYKSQRLRGLYFVAGVLLSCSFLSKQYGMLLVIPMAYYVFFSEEYLKLMLGNMMLFALGLGTPLLIYFGIYESQYGISPWSLIQAWTRYAHSYGERSLTKMLLAAGRFTISSLPFILLLGLSIKKVLKRAYLFLQSLLLAYGVLALSLYYQQYAHYFLLLIPLGVLIAVYSGQILWEEKRFRLLILLLLGLNIGLLSVRNLGAFQEIWQAQLTQARIKQYQLAEEVNLYIPPHKQVLLLTYFHQRLNYLCHFPPLDALQTGYTFPDNFSQAQLDTLMAKADWVLTEAYDLQHNPSYQTLLHRYHFQQRHILTNGLQLWGR